MAGVGRMTLGTKEERNAQMKRLAKKGYSVEEVSKKYGLSIDYIKSILNMDIDHAKKAALRAAKDFGYSNEIIKAVTNAVTEGEIEKAMMRGRKETFG